MNPLHRKIEKYIKTFFSEFNNKIPIIDGARQVGKSFIIKKVCSKIFPNFIEINLLEDSLNEKILKI